MAQYDVHRLRSGELLLDCQTNHLEMIGTRLVVPLVDPDDVPDALPRLHPLFRIEGETVLMATHLAAAIPASELRHRVASLTQHDFTISNALDFLLTGV